MLPTRVILAHLSLGAKPVFEQATQKFTRDSIAEELGVTITEKRASKKRKIKKNAAPAPWRRF